MKTRNCLTKMKSRQSNFELLRIICMLCIITFHLVMQTAIGKSYSHKDGLIYYYFIFGGSAGRLVCNTFVMIGAWFLSDNKFKAERVINLWLEILFYSVTITVLAFALQWNEFNIALLIQAFFPVFGRPVWFGAEYICLLILSPWLNKMINYKDEIVIKKLLFVFSVLIIGCATLFPIKHTTPAFSEIIWFCSIYLMIGLYKRGKLVEIEWIEKHRYLILIITYASIVMLQVIGDYSQSKVIYKMGIYYREHYESLGAFLCSLSLFFVFKNIKMKENRCINWCSKANFSVYILHQIPAFYPYMWNGIFHVNEMVSSKKIVLYANFVILCIFMISIIVDYVRMFFFNHFIYNRKGYKYICEIMQMWIVKEIECEINGFAEDEVKKKT